MHRLGKLPVLAVSGLLLVTSDSVAMLDVVRLLDASFFLANTFPRLYPGFVGGIETGPFQAQLSENPKEGLVCQKVRQRSWKTSSGGCTRQIVPR